MPASCANGKHNRILDSGDDGRLPSDLLAIVNGLWDTLQNKAEAQIEGYRQESEAQVSQILQQLTQARQLEANVRQNTHILEEQLHQQKEEVQQLTAMLMTESQEKIRMTERVAAFETRQQEHHAENQRLHQLLKHIQENLEHYQTATQKLKEEQSLLIEKQQHDYEQRLSRLLVQVNVAVSEKSACQAQYDQLVKGHEALMAEHKTLQQLNVEIHSQHEVLKIMHDKTQHDHDALKEQHQAQFSELSALQHAVIELKLNITSRNEKIRSLKEAIVSANDKIETLRHEGQFALQEKANFEGQLRQMQTMLPSGKMRAVG